MRAVFRRLRRRCVDLDDPRLDMRRERLAAGVLAKDFWNKLLHRDPMLTLLAMILKQACQDGASAVQFLMDEPGWCLRILEHVPVDEDFTPRPWRTADQRDWRRGYTPRPPSEPIWFVVEASPTPSSSRREWIQMQPLGSIFPIALPQCVRRLAGIGPAGVAGVLRLRYNGLESEATVEVLPDPEAGAIAAGKSSAPTERGSGVNREFYATALSGNLVIYLNSSRPAPRKFDDLPLWDRVDAPTRN